MISDPFPRSWTPGNVVAEMRLDWKSQMTTGGGRPEAIQSNRALSPSELCTIEGGHWIMALGTEQERGKEHISAHDSMFDLAMKVIIAIQGR